MPVSSPSSVLLIALAAMLWGGDLLLRPEALSSGWSPARVVLGEHLLLTLAFAPVLWRGLYSLTRLPAPAWRALLLVAWGGSALATWLYTLAFSLDFHQALTVLLLQKVQPVIALALAGIVLGERRRPGFWAWCALALAGAILLTGLTRAPALHDIHTEQALCALGAAALWGAATVAGRFLTPWLSPALLAGSRFALAIPALLLLLLVPTEQAHQATHGWPHAFLFLLLIVLLPDLLGMWLYYRGLHGTTASAATLAELCYPLTGLLIGLFVQHALLTPAQWIGLGLLLLAVLGLSFAPSVALSHKTPAFAPERVS